ncbi:MAG: glycosyl transferase group 1 [Mycobacterium sp.]|nr:glycosyl transferase group 1 [Mycobacterium sp.]
MRVGMVCPYTWDVPGGVQAHCRDLAVALLDLGHEVEVLTPVDDEASLPPYAVGAGRAVPVPYNGSVARLLLGPLSAARVRRWLKDGRFDVLHAHEPSAPSLSLLACYFAAGPVVATFHTFNPRSRLLATLQPLLVPALEKVTGRIAVSDAARRTVVEHTGSTPVVIPNGVDVAAYAQAGPLPDRPAGPLIAFVGRIDEPRKGLQVLLEALPAIVAHVPDATVWVAGPGDVEEVAAALPPWLRPAVRLLGMVDEATKRALYAAADVYVAPHTGQESFGIVLLEAMAAGTAVVASDIEAFRRVLGDGRLGRLFPPGNAAALAAAVCALLVDRAERARLVDAARIAVTAYDWPAVAARVVEVYETVVGAGPPVGLDPTLGADTAAGFHPARALGGSP